MVLLVDISGETALPGDEPSHLWLERGAHQERDTCDLEDGDSILSKIQANCMVSQPKIK